MPGRRCPHCDASLSPVARFPFLSWFGALPRCRACGTPIARLQPALEAAFLIIGLVAMFAAPMPIAILVALAGWAGLLGAVTLWRRLR